MGVTGVVAEESGGILMGEVGGGASIGVDMVAVDFGKAVLNGSVHVYSEMLIWIIIIRKGVC